MAGEGMASMRVAVPKRSKKPPSFLKEHLKALRCDISSETQALSRLMVA